MTTRERLPNRRAAETFEVEVGGLRYIATVGRFIDGAIAELFLSTTKQTRRQTLTRATRQSFSRLQSNTAPTPKQSATHFAVIRMAAPPACSEPCSISC